MISSAFSFTLTIPPSKKVYYGGKRRAYGSMNQKAQYTFLNNLLLKVIHSSHFEEIDWVFEEHEDRRLHIHGYAIVKPEYVPLSPVSFLVSSFYMTNQIIGITSNEVIKRLSNIQETEKNINFWLRYMEKNQHKIKFYSPLREERIETGKYELPYIKIETNPQKPDEWYEDAINGKLSPSSPKPKKYVNFSIKNKLIVEF